MAQQDHNSEEEIEEEEDNGPAENSKDNIEREDRIELYVVGQTIRHRPIVKIFLHGRDTHGQDPAGHWQRLCQRGVIREFLQDYEDLEAELSWSLHKTFDEFILHLIPPKESIVTEDSSESYKKND